MRKRVFLKNQTFTNDQFIKYDNLLIFLLNLSVK